MVKPLAHQLMAIDSLDKQFEKGNNKAMVVLPSGSGKTHAIAFHVKKLQPKSFLYIVHRDMILNQTVRIFKEICNLDDKQIGIINETNKDFNRRIEVCVTGKRHGNFAG